MNRFSALDESIEIPIEQLIRPAKKPNKKKTKSGRMGLSAAWATASGKAPKSAGPDFPTLPHGNPSDPSSYWCLKAVQNYENHMFATFGLEVAHTDIRVLRESSLGIEGWAMYDIGKAEPETSEDTGSSQQLKPLEGPPVDAGEELKTPSSAPLDSQ